MSDTVISVEGLGKRYAIGAQLAHYRTLRESAMGAALAPARRARMLVSRDRRSDASLRREFWALQDVSFEVRHGEVLGVVGRNGAGKSTLLKIVSRITEPTAGRVRMRGRVASLLEVGTGFHPELTGRENIYLNGAILGMRRTEIARKFDEILSFAGVERFVDTPVKRYSSGMYLRLAFAVAAHLEPEILLVDEVLAVGDAEFQKRCLGKMSEVAQSGRTVLFVSHNLGAVRSLCHRALLLEAGMLSASGPVAEVLEAYRRTYAGDSSSRAGLVYECPESLRGSDFRIDRVEMLDAGGIPMPTLYTWGHVRFRIHHFAARAHEDASVIMWVRSPDGVPLLRCSTAPDHDMRMKFAPGHAYVDCVFQRFPLSAGSYLLGFGLAQPNVEFLFRDEDAATLRVEPADVHESGLAPQSTWAIVASDHSWVFPSESRPR